MSRRISRSNVSSLVLEETRPLTDRERAHRRRMKMWRSYAWFCMAMMPITLLAVFVVLGNASGGTATNEPVESASSGSPSQSVAAASLQRWIGKSEQFERAVIAGWIDTETIEAPEPTKPGETKGFPVSTHRFTLVTAGGSLFVAGVQVEETDSGPVVVSAPSLEPSPSAPSTGGADTTFWPGLERAVAPEPVDKAVSFWANAWMSGDPEEVRQAIGDTSSKRFYTTFPVTEGVSVTTKIRSSARRKDGRMVVRAEITFRDGTEVALDSMELDVVVSNPATAAPTVVAWGAPGTGKVAKPYSNATTYKPEVSVAETPDEATTSTTTATTTAAVTP